VATIEFKGEDAWRVSNGCGEASDLKKRPQVLINPELNG
jgi:hypothetical protein